MELSIYTEMVKDLTPHKPTHWAIKFTKPGVLWREPVDPTYFKREVVPLMQKIRRAVADNDFPPKVGPLCLWCSQKGRCSAFGGPKA